MFKRFLLPMLCAWFAQPAYAEDYAEYYFTMSSGAVFTEDLDYTVGNSNVDVSYDEDAMFSMGLGMYFNDHFRGEIEVSYRESEIDSFRVNGVESVVTGRAESTAVMFNAYYDFLPTSLVNPYVGAGIGIMYQEADVTSPAGTIKGEGDGLAYQFGGGANIALTDEFLVFADYRYIGTEDVALREYFVHEVRAGINYLF